MKTNKPKAEKKGIPENMVRVNFNLDEERHIALKMYAINERTTVTQLLQDMIDKKLAGYK